MQRIIARYVSLMVAATMTLAVSTANAGVDELPADIKNSLYNNNFLDPNQPVGESAYRDWVAKNPPPWKIGYASSYAGNTWRAAVMDRLQNELVPKWKELGMLDEVIITQSNLNDATQIQQIRQLVDQGVTLSSSAVPTRPRSTRQLNMPTRTMWRFSPGLDI